MKFLVDAQLPPGLARWLVARGHEADHVFDIGLGAASDADDAIQHFTVGSFIVLMVNQKTRRHSFNIAYNNLACNFTNEFAHFVALCCDGIKIEMFYCKENILLFILIRKNFFNHFYCPIYEGRFFVDGVDRIFWFKDNSFALGDTHDGVGG